MRRNDLMDVTVSGYEVALAVSETINHTRDVVDGCS